MNGLILDPVVPVAALVCGVLVVAGFSIAALVRARGRRGARLDAVLRIVAVVLLLVVALRPTIPGGQAGPTVSGGLEVYFALDTTSSMAAEDVDAALATTDAGGPGTGTAGVPRRLDAARADIERIAAALDGARFSLVTFDAATVQRVPLTADASALTAALEVTTPEVTAYSRGSSIDAAVPTLESILSSARTSAPGDDRVLFYLGDGEQTSEDAVGSFASLAPYLTGGGVLGYGTMTGGPMREFDGYTQDDDQEGYIPDPADPSRPALSRIDESALGTIARQLGVAYTHRTAPGGIDGVVSGIDVGELVSEPGRPIPATEFYWIPAIPLAVLLLVLLARLVAPIAEARAARPASRPSGRRASRAAGERP
ncbi:VWA domain-containing protein [Galbitalea sp. SE-J8]|uniref:vWA domain-containing protein n=1 Tax=Galbitalea sp. SE-J8 TaxID=3054952 RepID=UPI00259C6C53|nr:VWA domain-containing protein [Galbitalea sp. SE-J8]MDM4763501.1 VWA domain-containing protein [Galbitalea sp. SE-J8]